MNAQILTLKVLISTEDITGTSDAINECLGALAAKGLVIDWGYVLPQNYELALPYQEGAFLAPTLNQGENT